jgi:NDP-sugar pyrophosphorylase family protein
MSDANRQAIVLAGGRGTRLKPYTTVFPKPLMPIGDMPILEVIIRQLRHHGFRRITLAVGHLAGLLQAYFGDGSKWGVDLDYSLEHAPLGTAGPLALIERPHEPFLVMNGDILTTLDYKRLIPTLQASNACAVVGVQRREVRIGLGVLELNADRRVTDYVEKPTLTYEASMGVYAFAPRALEHIPRGRPFDLPDLIRALIRADEAVIAYPHDGYWRDIGRPEEYEQAAEEFAEQRDSLLPGS